MIRIRPDLPEAHFNLGNALQSLGRFDEAIVAYRRAVELRPTYAEALNNLGNSLRSRGLYADAEGAYRKASAIDPNYADAQSNLGMSLQNQGLLEEAAATDIAVQGAVVGRAVLSAGAREEFVGNRAPRGMGWLRDRPDYRDYTADHAQIQPQLDAIGVAHPEKVSLASSVDLRAYCSPVEDQGALVLAGSPPVRAGD